MASTSPHLHPPLSPPPPPPDADDIYAAQWPGYRNAMSFVNPAVNQTTVPMFLGKGTEDNLIGGYEDAYYSLLPEATKKLSLLSVFEPPSGGALHCQIGER
jgi:hypothetical protein